VEFISPDARVTESIAAHRIVIAPAAFAPPLQLGATFQLHFITREDRLLWILLRRIHEYVK
jgi:hypothetical protein